ncbi:hypothetical protein IP88_11490 [alpha proteobacterium AAP81b]|nr:hypothetical protein IP88_11490 [alpha proteobacterium AAP81b]
MPGQAPEVDDAAGGDDAAGHDAPPAPGHVRNAGPDAMVGDEPDWDPVDQAMDESFPASDPPPASPGAD